MVVVRALFLQRRKTVRNGLKPLQVFWAHRRCTTFALPEEVLAVALKPLFEDFATIA